MATKGNDSIADNSAKAITAQNLCAGEWRCKTCHKPKDLRGPHLAGKQLVRSDCWPCGIKREFELVVLSAETKLVQPAVSPIGDRGMVGRDQTAVSVTTSRPATFPGGCSTGTAASTAQGVVTECAEWTCKTCGKPKDLRGPHLNGKSEIRSDCWPCGIKRVFVRSSAAGFGVKGSESIAAKPATAAESRSVVVPPTHLATPAPLAQGSIYAQGVVSECAEWTCKTCGKPKDLRGPHLNGKSEIRSDCWPCGIKRVFVRSSAAGFGAKAGSESIAAKPPTAAESRSVVVPALTPQAQAFTDVKKRDVAPSQKPQKPRVDINAFQDPTVPSLLNEAEYFISTGTASFCDPVVPSSIDSGLLPAPAGAALSAALQPQMSTAVLAQQLADNLRDALTGFVLQIEAKFSSRIDTLRDVVAEKLNVLGDRIGGAERAIEILACEQQTAIASARREHELSTLATTERLDRALAELAEQKSALQQTQKAISEEKQRSIAEAQQRLHEKVDWERWRNTQVDEVRTFKRQITEHIDEEFKKNYAVVPYIAEDGSSSQASQEEKQQFTVDLHVCNAFPRYGVNKRN